MLSSASGGQPRGARDRVQADPGADSGTSGLRFRLAPAATAMLAVLLSGCSSFPSSMNPVSWWHSLQGGAIAEQRPPPPGANEPYPNLATVPAKPAQPDRAALENLSNALIADRTNAQHLAAEAPLADPSSPSASPELFGKGTLPPVPPPQPPGTATASASMPAAEAPPVAATPGPTPSGQVPSGQAPASQASASSGPVPAPAKAPVGAVQSVPLAPPGAAAEPVAASGPTPTNSGRSATAAESGGRRLCVAASRCRHAGPGQASASATRWSPPRHRHRQRRLRHLRPAPRRPLRRRWPPRRRRPRPSRRRPSQLRQPPARRRHPRRSRRPR